MTRQIFIILLITLFNSCNQKNKEEIVQEKKVDSSLVYLKTLVDELTEKGVNIPESIERIIEKDTSTLLDNIKAEITRRKKQDSLYSAFGIINYEKLERDTLLNSLKFKGDEGYSFILRMSFSKYDHVLRIQKQLNTKDSTFKYYIIRKSYLSHFAKRGIELLPVEERNKIKDTINIFDKISIDEKEWNSFILKLKQADYWTLGESPDSGMDGSTWAIIGAIYDDNWTPKYHYHSVSRWSPQSSSYKDACTYLVKLYKKDIGEMR